MQYLIYDNGDVSFKTKANYTDGKVMVWEGVESLKPTVKHKEF